MRRKITRGTTVAAVTLVAALAGGVALAGGAFDRKAEQNAFLNDAAQRLKVSSDDLQKALLGAFDDRVDAAVAAGRMTKAQGDDLKARAAQGGVPLGVGGPAFGGHGERGFGHGGPSHLGGADVLDAAAAYIGVEEDALRSELASGKTLAQVAQDHGKTADGVKQAIHDATKKDLDQAVKDGRLTQAQADDALTRLDSKLDDVVTSQLRERGHFGGPRGGLGGAIGDVVDATSTYLGVDAATLRSELASGKTLEQVAKDHGKTKDGLEQAIRDAAKKEADQAVKDGTLTQDQADSVLQRLDSNLDQVVTGGLRFRFGHHRPGGGFGPPSDDDGGSAVPPAAAATGTA